MQQVAKEVWKVNPNGTPQKVKAIIDNIPKNGLVEVDVGSLRPGHYWKVHLVESVKIPDAPPSDLVGPAQD